VIPPAWGGLAAAMAVMTAVPAFGHWVRRSDPLLARGYKETPATHYIAGGRRITGMLVVADDAPRPLNVPSMTISQFSTIVRASGIESYQGLVTPKAPPLPFAFLTSARLEKASGSHYQYIAAPEVILRRDVPGWRLDLTAWQVKPPHGPYWHMVTNATPLVR
jgi:hypothetical protein